MKYRITKTGQFGNLIKKIVDLTTRTRKESHIKIINMRHDELLLELSDYGWTRVRILFYPPYFKIEKYE